MSGIDLREGGVRITEGKETVSLSREELAQCRHSLDVTLALESKLGHSLKYCYYFKYNALNDGWDCSRGSFGHDVQPKEVARIVEKIVERPEEPTMKALWNKWITYLKGAL